LTEEKEIKRRKTGKRRKILSNKRQAKERGDRPEKKVGWEKKKGGGGGGKRGGKEGISSSERFPRIRRLALPGVRGGGGEEEGKTLFLRGGRVKRKASTMKIVSRGAQGTGKRGGRKKRKGKVWWPGVD